MEMTASISLENMKTGAIANAGLALTIDSELERLLESTEQLGELLDSWRIDLLGHIKRQIAAKQRVRRAIHLVPALPGNA